MNKNHETEIRFEIMILRRVADELEGGLTEALRLEEKAQAKLAEITNDEDWNYKPKRHAWTAESRAKLSKSMRDRWRKRAKKKKLSAASSNWWTPARRAEAGRKMKKAWKKGYFDEKVRNMVGKKYKKRSKPRKETVIEAQDQVHVEPQTLSPAENQP